MKDSKQISSAYIKNEEEHVKLTAYCLVSMQNRILTINSTKLEYLKQTSIDNLEDSTSISILKLREFCTFLVDIKIIRHKDLDNIVKKFVGYQLKLAELTKKEIANLYNKSTEIYNKDSEDKLFTDLLEKLPKDEKIH